MFGFFQFQDITKTKEIALINIEQGLTIFDFRSAISINNYAFTSLKPLISE